MLYDPEGDDVAAARNRSHERVPQAGGVIAARWVRREGPLAGALRPLARFGGLLMEVWEALHRPERVPAEAPAPRLPDAGLLDAPSARAAYDLAAPVLVSPCR
ncbi:hypothetical protein ACWD4N_09710 [Streptomyces sp. NPDC002586]